MLRILTVLLILLHFSLSAQCDLAITDFNSITGDLVVEVINSENCGCNEFTNIDNTCENAGSPAVNNNTTISHIVLGLHSPGLDYNWGCTTTNNHPGWTFKAFTLFGNQVLDSGDSWSVNVYDNSTANECWVEMLANDTLCMELAMWQINLSQTATTDIGGWAVNPNIANQTQNYPDVNLDDNSVIVCPVVFPGCIDPFALNYNDEATEDDGTCVYSTGPDPIIIDLVVTNEECEVFEAGVLSTFAYSATIVNIGTEAVTYFCLNDFLGITFNCFNGVSNLAVWIQPGDTITVYGNINVEGTWFEGQGNFMTITSVPGEIITANNNFVFYMPDGVDCEEIEEPCDTIFIDVPIYEIDTIFIELPQDTIIEYIELPQDTVVVYQVDTVITQEYVYITDTLIEYVDVYVVDTIIEYITDFIIDTLYIFETDTLTIIETLLIDCETGEDCTDPPGISDCWPWTVYIPNTFTPNNDGINDIWQIVYNLDCWVDVEFRIFNRWGEMIYHGYDFNFSSYPFWDGSINGGGYYAADGVYVYTFYGRREDSPEILEESGTISIFR